MLRSRYNTSLYYISIYDLIYKGPFKDPYRVPYWAPYSGGSEDKDSLSPKETVRVSRSSEMLRAQSL